MTRALSFLGTVAFVLVVAALYVVVVSRGHLPL